MASWLYETGREESEIYGSGSRYYNVFYTRDLEVALKKAYEGGRTYLSRSCRKEDGTTATQTYDGINKEWS